MGLSGLSINRFCCLFFIFCLWWNFFCWVFRFFNLCCRLSFFNSWRLYRSILLWLRGFCIRFGFFGHLLSISGKIGLSLFLGGWSLLRLFGFVFNFFFQFLFLRTFSAWFVTLFSRCSIFLGLICLRRFDLRLRSFVGGVVFFVSLVHRCTFFIGDIFWWFCSFGCSLLLISGSWFFISWGSIFARLLTRCFRISRLSRWMDFAFVCGRWFFFLVSTVWLHLIFFRLTSFAPTFLFDDTRICSLLFGRWLFFIRSCFFRQLFLALFWFLWVILRRATFSLLSFFWVFTWLRHFLVCLAAITLLLDQRWENAFCSLALRQKLFILTEVNSCNLRLCCQSKIRGKIKLIRLWISIWKSLSLARGRWVELTWLR